jgi:uncharacterized delta-60 repeat protein
MKKTTFLSLLLLFISFNLFSQAGSLDETFGVNGVTTTDLNDYEKTYDLAIQSDGKIITTGFTRFNDDNYVPVVARYETDGFLDSSFGTHGIVLLASLPGDNPSGRSISLQQDGKIVIGVEADDDFVITRLLTGGTLDPSFGNNGIVITDISQGLNTLGSILIQPDGKIIAVGITTVLSDTSNNTNFLTVVRYKADGSLDPTFGTNGIVNLGKDYSFFLFSQPSADLTPSGEIVVISSYQKYAVNNAVVVKLKNNGSLDSAFGNNGTLPLKSPEVDFSNANDVKVLTNNKILVSGSGNRGALLMKLNAGGSRDTTFGNKGFVQTNTEKAAGGADGGMVIQQDGKIVLAGNVFAGNGEVAFLLRYMTDGSLDNTFGNNGLAYIANGANYLEANSVAIQNNSKIVIGGQFFWADQNNSDFFLARFNGDNNLAIRSSNEKNNATTAGKKISIFPNPASNTLTLTGLNPRSSAIISIIDNSGKLVSKTISPNQSNYTINISNLKSGIYFLQYTENGKTVSLKFLKR